MSDITLDEYPFIDPESDDFDVELPIMLRRDQANKLTALYPTVLEYIKHNNANLANDIADYQDFYIPVPLAPIEIYSDDIFVANTNNDGLVRYHYVYYYEPGNYNEPPFTEEYVEWKPVS